MKELTIISGKGGTGKTSLTASFAALAHQPVIADCDVDAADLHLVLAPEVQERHPFYSGHEASIRQADCVACGLCMSYCRFNAVVRNTADFLNAASACKDCDFCQRTCDARANEMIQTMRAASGETSQTAYQVNPIACEGCGVCVRFCPVHAIDFPERLCGEWMASRTRFGPMVHAQLDAAGENSGKLVTQVRNEARRIAEQEGLEFILTDGPPGIGCPVIASLTGASMALVVAEPTRSGEHDMKRVLELAKHFGVPAAVCVNKYDINTAQTEAIENEARRLGASIAGRIRYAPEATAAQVEGVSIVEYSQGALAADIKAVWREVAHHMSLPEKQSTCAQVRV